MVFDSKFDVTPPELPKMSTSDYQLLSKLLHGERWGVLATLDESGAPQTSHVAFVMEGDCQSILMHLSELAPHTRNFRFDDRVSLAVCEADAGSAGSDPQQLARVALEGQVEKLVQAGHDYPASRQRYLAALPHAEPLFDFSDFALYRMRVESGRLVGGFGRARRGSKGDPLQDF